MHNWWKWWCISVVFPYVVFTTLLYLDGDSAVTITTRLLLMGTCVISICGSAAACATARFSVIHRILLFVVTWTVVHPILFIAFWIAVVLVVGPIQP